MGGQVVRPEVSLDFDKTAPQARVVDLAHEHLAQQFPRDRDRVAIEKLPAEDGAVGLLSQTRPGPGRGRPSCDGRGGVACPHKEPCPPARTLLTSPSPAATR